MTFKKLHTLIQADQAAVIPYRIFEGKIEVLLITTRNKGKWIVPKGWIEPDLASFDSARKEAMEEAGVKGSVSPVPLGCYRHGSTEKDPVVEVFLMRVDRELPSWPEKSQRKRRWVSLEEAYEHVEEEGLKSILDEAAVVMHLSLDDAASPLNGSPHPAIPSNNARLLRSWSA